MAAIGKSLERGFRRAFLRSLRWRAARGTADAPAALPPCPSILLIRHDRIGDALVSTPVFALLRERFPEARIDVLLGRKNRDVAPLLPCVDACIVTEGTTTEVIDTLRAIRRRRYDLAINLLAKDSASGALLTALSGARIRIGFRGEAESVYDLAVAKPSAPMHIVRETALLLDPLGIGPIGENPTREAEHLRVDIPDESMRCASELAGFLFAHSARRRVILNISGSSPEKFWGVEQYIELCGRLHRSGFRPIVAGSPGDREPIERIAAGAACEALPATGSFAGFAAMLSRGDIIVTPDTSVVHLSAALRRPTVMLVASDSAGRFWRPWGTPHAVVRHNLAISRIPVDDVMAGIDAAARAGSLQSFPTA